jgi:hypothetical protein
MGAEMLDHATGCGVSTKKVRGRPSNDGATPLFPPEQRVRPLGAGFVRRFSEKPVDQRVISIGKRYRTGCYIADDDRQNYLNEAPTTGEFLRFPIPASERSSGPEALYSLGLP